MTHGVSPPRAQQAIAYLVSRGVAPEAAEQRVASVSRQRVWQLVRQAEGRCRVCGAPADGYLHCLRHRLSLAKIHLAYRKRKREAGR